MKKQFSFISLILAFALSACSENNQEQVSRKIGEKIVRAFGIDAKLLDPNTPIPEQPLMPNFLTDEEIKNKIAENQKYINSKIVKKDSKTIYYFQEEKQKNDKTIYTLTNDKNQAKYYRVILGKTAENYCAVQDFYANGEKRTEQYIIIDTNCTKFVPNPSPIAQVRNYLTLVSYRPQEKLMSVSTVDIKNKTITYYYHSNPNDKDYNTEHWIETTILRYDFNFHQQYTFLFNKNKEIDSTRIYSFNQNQITEQVDIYNIPYKEDENKTSTELANKITNIDFEHSTYEHIMWNKSDRGNKWVMKVKVIINEKNKENKTLNKLEKTYQNIMKAKKLIDIK